MTETLKTNKCFVPDGILHDQGLKSVSFENGKLKMEFDIEWFWDYDENELIQKYKGFKTCVMELDVPDDKDFTFVNLYKAIKRGNKISGIEIPFDKFISLLKTDYVSLGYSSTYVSDVGIIINFSFNAKKGKYKKYFTAELYTYPDEITFIWE